MRSRTPRRPGVRVERDQDAPSHQVVEDHLTLEKVFRWIFRHIRHQSFESRTCTGVTTDAGQISQLFIRPEVRSELGPKHDAFYKPLSKQGGGAERVNLGAALHGCC